MDFKSEKEKNGPPLIFFPFNLKFPPSPLQLPSFLFNSPLPLFPVGRLKFPVKNVGGRGGGTTRYVTDQCTKYLVQSDDFWEI